MYPLENRQKGQHCGIFAADYYDPNYEKMSNVSGGKEEKLSAFSRQLSASKKHGKLLKPFVMYK